MNDALYTSLMIGGIVVGLLFFGALVVFLLKSRTPENLYRTDNLVRLVLKTQFSGHDLPGGSQSAHTVEDCGNACISSNKCKAYSYNTKTKQCSLKEEIGDQFTQDDVISGIIVNPATTY